MNSLVKAPQRFPVLSYDHIICMMGLQLGWAGHMKEFVRQKFFRCSQFFWIVMLVVLFLASCSYGG